ncbi:MAG: hypothetical protein WCS99_00870 [Limisphaerales bacterium]
MNRQLAMNPIRLSALIVALAATVAQISLAADKKTPEGKSILTPDLLKTTQLNAGPKPSGEFKIVDVKDQPFKQAINARVKERPTDPWTVQISTLTTQAVKAGEVVLVSFRVRTLESKNEGGKGHFTVFFGVPNGPEQTVGAEVDAGAKWTLVQIPATIAADYEAGKSMLNLDLGYEPQVLEFADIKLLHYGRSVKESDLPRSGF